MFNDWLKPLWIRRERSQIPIASSILCEPAKQREPFEMPSAPDRSPQKRQGEGASSGLAESIPFTCPICLSSLKEVLAQSNEWNHTSLANAHFIGRSTPFIYSPSLADGTWDVRFRGSIRIIEETLILSRTWLSDETLTAGTTANTTQEPKSSSVQFISTIIEDHEPSPTQNRTFDQTRVQFAGFGKRGSWGLVDNVWPPALQRLLLHCMPISIKSS